MSCLLASFLALHQLAKMSHRLRTGVPDLSTRIIVAVLFVLIVSTIIVVKLLHESHQPQQHEPLHLQSSTRPPSDVDVLSKSHEVIGGQI